MIYIMSDIHGEYSKFQKMLNMIKYNNTNDVLYIIGDIFDRGTVSGIRILDKVKEYLLEGSMVYLKGNHEYFAEKYIERKISDKRYSAYGGDLTMKDVDRLPEIDKMKLHNYLKNLPLYYELDTDRYGKVILTHTGLMKGHLVYNSNGRIDVIKSIEEAACDEYAYLINIDMYDFTYDLLQKLDKFLIVGHVRTYTINEDASSKIYRTPYFINIDSGAGQGSTYGVLSCYCLDTDEEFYT